MGEKTKTKKKRYGGKLLTTLIVLLCVAGVLTIAYPFVLTGVMERNKDEVVRALEAELPIYRDEADFVPIDIASMEVVEPPVWSSDERAQAAQPMGVLETLLGEDARAAFSNVLGGGTPTAPPGANLPAGALPTLIPQVMESADQFMTLAPEDFLLAQAQETPAPTPRPRPTDLIEEGVEILYTEAPHTAEPGGEDQTQLAQAEPTLGPQVAQAEGRQLAEERQRALEEILRAQAPVYYEDFEETLARAQELNEHMTSLSMELSGSRQSPIADEVRMTFQGIQAQFLATQSLFTVVEDLPSTNQGQAIFQDREGQDRTVLVRDGVDMLYESLRQLGRAHVTTQTVAVYKDAQEEVQLALDEIVLLGDQVQNALDYMAKYLSDVDGDLYLRYRASSMVGETEALYLLEIPSINLKVGIFQDLTFEQMYKSMRKGAALFPRMGTPNTNTNITMSAHRSGSAAFFKDFDQLQNGDEILLHTRTLGSFRYIIDGVTVVESDDWTTTFSVGYPALTLISCEEFRGISHGKRIVVRGRLVGVAKQ